MKATLINIFAGAAPVADPNAAPAELAPLNWTLVAGFGSLLVALIAFAVISHVRGWSLGFNQED